MSDETDALPWGDRRARRRASRKPCVGGAATHLQEQLVDHDDSTVDEP